MSPVRHTIASRAAVIVVSVVGSLLTVATSLSDGPTLTAEGSLGVELSAQAPTVALRATVIENEASRAVAPGRRLDWSADVRCSTPCDPSDPRLGGGTAHWIDGGGREVNQVSLDELLVGGEAMIVDYQTFLPVTVVIELADGVVIDSPLGLEVTISATVTYLGLAQQNMFEDDQALPDDAAVTVGIEVVGIEDTDGGDESGTGSEARDGDGDDSDGDTSR